ncbi:hypothetical protein Tco_0378283 [Tanacetum coccineum]
MHTTHAHIKLLLHYQPLLLPSASHRMRIDPRLTLHLGRGYGIALWFPVYEVGESSTRLVLDSVRVLGQITTLLPLWQRSSVSTDTDWVTVQRNWSMVRRDIDEITTMIWLRTSRAETVIGSGSILCLGKVMSLRTTVHAQMSEITELQSADRSRRRAISDLLETDRGRHEEMRELRAADRTRQRAGDSFTGTGDDITGAGYCITGTAGTRWGSCTARAARGGW